MQQSSVKEDADIEQLIGQCLGCYQLVSLPGEGGTDAVLKVRDVMLLDLRAREQCIVLPEAVGMVRQVSLAVDCSHHQDVPHCNMKRNEIMLIPKHKHGSFGV